MIVCYIAVTKASDALLTTSKSNLLEQAQRLSSIVESNLELQERLANTIATDPSLVEVVALVNENGVDTAKDDIAQLHTDMQNKYKALGEKYNGIFVSDKNGFKYTCCIKKTFY